MRPGHSGARAQVGESLPGTGASNKIFSAPFLNMSRQPRTVRHPRKPPAITKVRTKTKKQDPNLWKGDVVKRGDNFKNYPSSREIQGHTVPMKSEQNVNLREHWGRGCCKELLEIKNKTAETKLSAERLKDR